MINHDVQTLDGKTVSLSAYRGQALLIVNTASQCGYTPQYKNLEALHQKYKDKGLVVMGFPCNDFGAQEPGGPEEIRQFCETRYNVTFPLFAKVKAKGPDKSPLYQTLTGETGEGVRGEVKWNFTKFLVNGRGEVVARFEPGVDPLDPQLVEVVEKILPKSGC